MIFEEILTPHIQNIMKKSALTTLFIVGVLLILSYTKIIIFGILSPFLDIILWGYLFLNLSTASVANYWKIKKNPECPQCGKKLKILNKYQCENCGTISFRKRKGI